MSALCDQLGSAARFVDGTLWTRDSPVWYVYSTQVSSVALFVDAGSRYETGKLRDAADVHRQVAYACTTAC